MIDFNFNSITIYGIVIVFLLLYILPKVIKIVLLIAIFAFAYLFLFPKNQNSLIKIINSWRDFDKIDVVKSKQIKESVNEFIDKEKYMDELLKSKNCEKDDAKYTYDSLITNKYNILEKIKYLFINSDYPEFNKDLKHKVSFMEDLLNKKLQNYHKKILKKFETNVI